MTHAATTPSRIHEGRSVKRFHKMLGINQDALAADLGDDWNQQKISLLEQKETIDAPLLQQISAVIKIPVKALQNFDEEQTVNVIANIYSFQDFKDNAVPSGFTFQRSSILLINGGAV